MIRAIIIDDDQLVGNPKFDNMLLILAIPDDSLWEQEIKWLYSLVQ